MARLAAVLSLAFVLPVVGGVIDIGDYGGLVSDNFLPQFQVAADPAGDSYFVFHREHSKFRGQRVKAADGSLDGAAVEIDDALDAQAGGVAVAWGDGVYLAAYQISSQVYATFVNPDGSIRVRAVPVNVAEEIATFCSLAVAFDGRHFLVVWQATDAGGFGAASLLARRFDSSGAAAGPSFKVTESESEAYSADQPAVAALASPGSLLVAYRRPADSGAGIGCRIVTADNSVGEEQVLDGGSTGTAIWPRVAASTSPREFLVVWEETDCDLRGGYSDPTGVEVGDVMFRRVREDGSPVGSGPVVLQGGAEIDVAPDVAWVPGSGSYAVHWQRGVYQSDTAVLGARIRAGQDGIEANGEIINDGPDDQLTPALAARGAGSQLLCVWGGETKVQGIRCALTSDPPRDPTDLGQFLQDGSTSIPGGGATRGPACLLKAFAWPSSGSGFMRFQVRLAKVNEPYAGDPITSTGLFGPGEVSLDPGGLELHASYRWEARMKRESDGLVSAWVPFGSDDIAEADFRVVPNSPPTFSAPFQSRGSNGAAIAFGALVSGEQEVVLGATIGDPDGDPVSLQVEVCEVGRLFREVPTASSEYRVDPGPVSFRFPLPAGKYRWRIKMVDRFPFGETGWEAVGGNPEEEADFELTSFGSAGNSTCVGGTAGVAGPWAWLLLLISGRAWRTPRRS